MHDDKPVITVDINFLAAWMESILDQPSIPTTNFSKEETGKEMTFPAAKIGG